MDPTTKEQMRTTDKRARQLEQLARVLRDSHPYRAIDYPDEWVGQAVALLGFLHGDSVLRRLLLEALGAIECDGYTRTTRQGDTSTITMASEHGYFMPDKQPEGE